MIAPSGLGYTYPSVWPAGKLAAFGEHTAEALAATAAVTGQSYSAVDVIGDPCAGGVYFDGCPAGLNSPNMTVWARLGWFSVLSVLHSKSVLYASLYGCEGHVMVQNGDVWPG
jgi:hypothetical protein